MKKEIKSSNEMILLWEKLAKKFNKILLYWDLWAGKTHLVKWFAKWLWINPEIVTSPTYTYVNIYNNKLLHIDMYRINNFEILLDKWILDLIDQFEYICIERPKRQEHYTDESWIKIIIEKVWEKDRKIIIK